MVTFNTILQSAYDGLANKDGDALYFVSDTHRVYKGGTLYTGKIELVSSFPASGEVGVVYIAESDLEGRIWQNGAWVTVAKGFTGKLDVLPSGRGGEVIISQTSGDIEVSGSKIGGATIASIPSADVLATEAAVAAVRTTLQGSINAVQSSLAGKVDTSSITTTLSASNPSASKIPSESAVVAALTWRNLTT